MSLGPLVSRGAEKGKGRGDGGPPLNSVLSEIDAIEGPEGQFSFRDKHTNTSTHKHTKTQTSIYVNKHYP